MQPDPYPAGREQSEQRRAVDDGFIWPIERDRMVTRRPITDRMVEDIAALVRDGGEAAVVTLEDLARKGWSAGQLAACGRVAFALWKAGEAETNTRRVTGGRTSIRRMATEAAALTLFLIPVLLFAGVAAGAI